MPKYKLVVLSRPVEGREGEYNEWYQNKHLGEVVAIDGIKLAQRFRLARPLSEGETHPYLAIYEIETDNLDSVLAEFNSRPGAGQMFISDSLDMNPLYAAVYEEFGAPVKG